MGFFYFSLFLFFISNMVKYKDGLSEILNNVSNAEQNEKEYLEKQHLGDDIKNRIEVDSIQRKNRRLRTMLLDIISEIKSSEGRLSEFEEEVIIIKKNKKIIN